MKFYPYEKGGGVSSCKLNDKFACEVIFNILSVTVRYGHTRIKCIQYTLARFSFYG